MSIFTTILEKLGLHKPAAPTTGTAAAPTPKPAPGGGMAAKPNTPVTPGAMAPSAPTAPPPAPVAMVDVLSKLDKMAGDNPGLDWKVSIVDLLKLLGIDSSLSARKELAQELGCPPELMGGDSAKMNVWLHKTVLQKIAENGGNIPKELLD